MTAYDTAAEVAAGVAAALADGGAVVALESTLIAHGLPNPENIETALAMEAAVRAAGAVPATIAVLKGQIRVGCSQAQIESLATSNPDKVAARDLAAALAGGRDGATTVSATMVCAHRAGIAVMATGGIGGVHRGAAESFDVSADLTELAATPVAVVCSGAKSILDLGRTQEVLETYSVPVVGYGTDRLPAFHAADSGLALETSVHTPEEAAALIAAHARLGRGGLVITSPVPEGQAIPADELEIWIEAALAAASARGIAGKAVTPFLLAQLALVSNGRTLKANIALAVNNARVGGEIAVALAKRRK
ncbi:MAG TPA: pseudouridine-5'-phosphate glycosidase [Alphaproteobacteria bacterium]|nr:pseudouridine-5'-phosphate glycosidase [Alphaproteobacteria bacterium]